MAGVAVDGGAGAAGVVGGPGATRGRLEQASAPQVDGSGGAGGWRAPWR